MLGLKVTKLLDLFMKKGFDIWYLISILILLLIMLVSAAISFINKGWQEVFRIEIDMKKFNYGQLKTRSFLKTH
jgi:hypothetical protein